MNKENLEKLSRKELQQVAKDHGLKANKKSIDLINELLAFSPAIQNDVQKNETAVVVAQVQTIQVEEKEVKEEIKKEEPKIDNTTKGDIQTNVIVQENYQYQVGDQILFNHAADEKNLANGKIKRINKLSMRVILTDGKEMTIPNSQIIGLYSSVPLSSLTDQVEETPIENENEVEITERAESVEKLETVEKEEEKNEITDNFSSNCAADTARPSEINLNEESTLCDDEKMSSELELFESQSSSTTTVDENYSNDQDDDENDNDSDGNEDDNEDDNEDTMNLQDSSLLLDQQTVDSSEMINPNNVEIPIMNSPIAIPKDEEDLTMSMNICNDNLIGFGDSELFFPITPKGKVERRRRSSLLRSTKAQRARALAIALKKERLSVACSNTQSTFPKSPFSIQQQPPQLQPKEIHVSQISKKISESYQRSHSTSRATLNPSMKRNLKETKTIHATPTARTRVSMATPISDKMARLQEAKQKANNYIRSNSKSTSTSTASVPDFQKVHQQSFNKQKSITSIVKENKEIHSKMNDAMKTALQTPNKSSSSSIQNNEQCRSVVKNPFDLLLFTKNDENNSSTINLTRPTKQSLKSQQDGGLQKHRQADRREKFHKEGKALRESKMNFNRGV